MNKSNFAQAVYPYHSYETSKSLDFIYKDSLTAQVKDIFSTLDKFYESIANEFNKNYIIIEIGTYFGGFTKILSDSNLGKNSNGIYTFDIEDLKLNKRQYMIEKQGIILPDKKIFYFNNTKKYFTSQIASKINSIFNKEIFCFMIYLLLK